MLRVVVDEPTIGCVCVNVMHIGMVFLENVGSTFLSVLNTHLREITGTSFGPK